MADKFSDDSAINDDFFGQFSHQSIDCDRENGDVVVASRIQLFRNVAEHSFVGVSSEEQQLAVRNTITSCIGRSSELEDLPIVNSDQLKEIERQFLLELQSVIDSVAAESDVAETFCDDEMGSPDVADDFAEADGVAEDVVEVSLEDVSLDNMDMDIGNAAMQDTVFGELDLPAVDSTENIADRIRSEDLLESKFLQRIEDATSLADFDAPLVNIDKAKIDKADFGDVDAIPSHEVSLTINEEDHLRLQLLAAGCPLNWMWQKISHIEDRLSDDLNFAFSPKWGYLSASPANVGTGMRVTVLLHLPALATLGRLDAIFLALMREGIVGRGVYSEEAWGDFFRIGNQVTLGKSETSLINLVRSVVPAIVDYERAARKQLFHQYGDEIKTQTADACRALKLPVQRSDEEALALISTVRLGIAFGMISDDQAIAVRSNFELTRLKRKLEVAIIMEHYDSATKYRDQIRQLEQRHYGH